MNRTPVAKFFGIALFALVALAATSCGTNSTSSSGENPPAIAATIHIADGKFEPREIEIEVSGAILSPGKYLFSPGVTLKEVLQRAGISKQADRSYVSYRIS